MKHVLIMVLASLAVSFSATVQADGHKLKGDPVAGKARSATCVACHGADGNSYGPDWPHLAGQHANYIAKQVLAFQEGKRSDPTMSAMVAGISKNDIDDIAAFFASKAITTQEEKNEIKIVAAGRTLYKGGNYYKGIPACAGCHSPTGAGNRPGVIPALAGQRVQYIIKSLKDFRSGTRSNDTNSIMQNVAAKMSDNDIKVVAAYIAEMK